jgi:methionyl aminopeptidase
MASFSGLTSGARQLVVRDYCGHGIGRGYHEDPQVLHYGRRNTGLLLKERMILTVEPMINAGDDEVAQLDDGWSVVTRDGSLSAQWEHMIAVTSNGFGILTPWPKG